MVATILAQGLWLSCMRAECAYETGEEPDGQAGERASERTSERANERTNEKGREAFAEDIGCTS